MKKTLTLLALMALLFAGSYLIGSCNNDPTHSDEDSGDTTEPKPQPRPKLPVLDSIHHN